MKLENKKADDMSTAAYFVLKKINAKDALFTCLIFGNLRLKTRKNLSFSFWDRITHFPIIFLPFKHMKNNMHNSLTPLCV